MPTELTKDNPGNKTIAHCGDENQQCEYGNPSESLWPRHQVIRRGRKVVFSRWRSDVITGRAAAVNDSIMVLV